MRSYQICMFIRDPMQKDCFWRRLTCTSRKLNNPTRIFSLLNPCDFCLIFTALNPTIIINKSENQYNKYLWTNNCDSMYNTHTSLLFEMKLTDLRMPFSQFVKRKRRKTRFIHNDDLFVHTIASHANHLKLNTHLVTKPYKNF